MRCAKCGWPQSEARTMSTHHTSEGWVRYKRCACGGVSIELVTPAPVGAGVESRLVSPSRL
jgi:hypothetical protein